MAHFFVLLKIILQLCSKIYWVFKKGKIVNPGIFVGLSFLHLGNIRGDYLKYFQNKISETGKNN